MTDDERKIETFKKLYKLTKNGVIEWDLKYISKDQTRNDFIKSEHDDCGLLISFVYKKNTSGIDHVWVEVSDKDDITIRDTFIIYAKGEYKSDIEDLSDIIFTKLSIGQYRPKSILENFLGGDKSERREKAIDDLLGNTEEKENKSGFFDKIREKFKK